MKKFGRIFIFAIYYGAGALGGVLMGREALRYDSFIFGLISMLIPFLLALAINIALHEAGHLIFGLLSGYSFISYRLGSFMIMKSNGRFRFARLSVAGTGGQCLMLPPDNSDGNVPCVLYNLGGVIVNVIFGAIMLILAVGSDWNPFPAMLSIFAFAMALANGIPLNAGFIANDGMNALMLRKNPAALEAICLQLRVAAAQADGKRLRELPDEWFEMPEDDSIDSNTHVASKAVLIENRLLDEGRLDETLALAQRLCRSVGVLDLYKQLLKLDMISVLYLTGRPEEAGRLFDERALGKTMKLLKVFPACIRTRYIAAKLGDKGNEVTARLNFERVSHKYPYKGEIESERELMSLADSVNPDGR